MHKARAFFYIAAGLFLLALVYHLGATSATAQAPGNPAVALANEGTGGYILALTANGDVYRAQGYTRTYSFELVGNIFGTGPVPAQRESFGSVKSRYRGERGAARPSTQDK